jgi:queuosine precursor transporter
MASRNSLLDEPVLRTETRGMALALIGMIGAVLASNYLVQFQINDWLTWGAFTYPVTFLVTDLTNRFFGPRRARQVAYVGFAIAVVLSLWLADQRIAIASGAAFLIGQLLDIHIFNRLRRSAWWRAPFIGSVLGSIVDTAIFFTIAFAGTGLPVLNLMAGDLSVKLACALLFLAPFRALMNVMMPVPAAQTS